MLKTSQNIVWKHLFYCWRSTKSDCSPLKLRCPHWFLSSVLLEDATTNWRDNNHQLVCLFILISFSILSNFAKQHIHCIYDCCVAMLFVLLLQESWIALPPNWLLIRRSPQWLALSRNNLISNNPNNDIDMLTSIISTDILRALYGTRQKTNTSVQWRPLKLWSSGDAKHRFSRHTATAFQKPTEGLFWGILSIPWIYNFAHYSWVHHSLTWGQPMPGRRDVRVDAGPAGWHACT